MRSDLELLQDYARNQSEDSSSALVNRHLNLVYSAALRQVRSPQLAEEVAQAVFMDLSQSAATLRPDTILTAWLYQVTRRSAADVVRRESRRQLREQVATEMNTMNAAASDWTHRTRCSTKPCTRSMTPTAAAVLLRYFENKSLREVGAALGSNEDAARKRVEPRRRTIARILRQTRRRRRRQRPRRRHLRQRRPGRARGIGRRHLHRRRPRRNRRSNRDRDRRTKAIAMTTLQKCSSPPPSPPLSAPESLKLARLLHCGPRLKRSGGSRRRWPTSWRNLGPRTKAFPTSSTKPGIPRLCPKTN